MRSDRADKDTLGTLMVIAAIVHEKEVEDLRIEDIDALEYVFSDGGALDQVLIEDRGYTNDYIQEAERHAKVQDEVMARVMSAEVGIANITLEEFRRSSTYRKLSAREEGISLDVDEDSDDEYEDAEDGVLESEMSESTIESDESEISESTISQSSIDPQMIVSAQDSAEPQQQGAARRPSSETSMLLIDDVIEKIKKICVGWTIDDKRPQVTSGLSAERQGVIEVSGTVKRDNSQEDQLVKFQVEKNKITTPNANVELYEKMIRVFQELNPGKKIQIKVAPNSASAKALDEAIKLLVSRNELKVKYQILPTSKAAAAMPAPAVSRPRP